VTGEAEIIGLPDAVHPAAAVLLHAGGTRLMLAADDRLTTYELAAGQPCRATEVGSCRLPGVRVALAKSALGVVAAVVAEGRT